MLIRSLLIWLALMPAPNLGPDPILTSNDITAGPLGYTLMDRVPNFLLRYPMPMFMFSVQAGDWNTGSTWNTGIVPVTTDNVCIQHAVTWSTGYTINFNILGIIDGGSLVAVANPGDTLTMLVGHTFQIIGKLSQSVGPFLNNHRYLLPDANTGGLLQIGTPASPIPATATVTITFKDSPFSTASAGSDGTSNGEAKDPQQYGHGLVCVGGRIVIHGAEKTRIVQCAGEPAALATSFTLASAPVNWADGDAIFLPDSHLPIPSDPNQMTYTDYFLCSGTPSGTTLNLRNGQGAGGALKYDHPGGYDVTNTLDPACRPHVVNLTCNVLFKSQNQANTTRPHIYVTDFSYVDVQHCSTSGFGRTTSMALNDTTYSVNPDPSQSAPASYGTVSHYGDNVDGRRSWNFYNLVGRANQTIAIPGMPNGPSGPGGLAIGRFANNYVTNWSSNWWGSTTGTQQISNSGQLGASGAGTISTTGSFATWPASGLCLITNAGVVREFVFYSSRTAQTLTVPATGRARLGTSQSAGAGTDTLDSHGGQSPGSMAATWRQTNFFYIGNNIGLGGSDANFPSPTFAGTWTGYGNGPAFFLDGSGEYDNWLDNNFGAAVNGNGTRGGDAGIDGPGLNGDTFYLATPGTKMTANIAAMFGSAQSDHPNGFDFWLVENGPFADLVGYAYGRPHFPGEDPVNWITTSPLDGSIGYDPSQVPLASTSGCVAYGGGTGFTDWWVGYKQNSPADNSTRWTTIGQSVFADFVSWNIGGNGWFGYQKFNQLILRWKHRAPVGWTVVSIGGYTPSDYEHGKVEFKDCDIQGVGVGISIDGGASDPAGPNYKITTCSIAATGANVLLNTSFRADGNPLILTLTNCVALSGVNVGQGHLLDYNWCQSGIQSANILVDITVNVTTEGHTYACYDNAQDAVPTNQDSFGHVFQTGETIAGGGFIQLGAPAGATRYTNAGLVANGFTPTYNHVTPAGAVAQTWLGGGKAVQTDTQQLSAAVYCIF